MWSSLALAFPLISGAKNLFGSFAPVVRSVSDDSSALSSRLRLREGFVVTGVVEVAGVHWEKLLGLDDNNDGRAWSW